MNPASRTPRRARLRTLPFVVIAAIGCAFTGSACAAGLAPDAAMMAAPETIARFVDTQDDKDLSAAFTARDVTIIDNFPPYLFTGSNAVAQWANGLRRHVSGITNLRHKFGPAQEFSRTGDLAYFSLPVEWTELYFGKPVTEHGAMAFVLVRADGKWRVKGSVWARIDSSAH